MRRFLMSILGLIISFGLATSCGPIHKSEKQKQEVRNNEAKQEVEKSAQAYHDLGFDIDRVARFLAATKYYKNQNVKIDVHFINPELCYIEYIPVMKRCAVFCKAYYNNNGTTMSVLDSCEEVEDEILNIHTYKKKL